jgi:hypothetical protein
MEALKNIWVQLLTNVESFVADKWNDLKQEAVDDSVKFLTAAKDDILRWFSLFAEEKLSYDELEWLLKGKRDSAELLYLKQKGLAKPELDKFLNGLLETIIATSLKLII